MSKKQSKWSIDGRITRSKSANGSNKDENQGNQTKQKEKGDAMEEKSKEKTPSYAGVASTPVPSTSTASVREEVTELMSPAVAVYFEPINTEKEFPNQPVELGKILTQNQFKDYQEVTQIGRFRFKVEVASKDADRIKSLNLANHNLKIHTPQKSN